MPEGLEQTEAPQDAPSSGYEVIPTSADTPFSPHEAARALAQYRYKRDAREEREAAAPIEAAAPESEPSHDEPEPSVEATQETEATEPAVPAVELPKSWAKDKADLWGKLDPELREYLVEQDSQNNRAVKRSLQEAADQRKSWETKSQEMEQIRKQYEEALPTLLASLQQNQAGDFSDIKTMQDVEKLAREDWPRYALWDAHQKKIAAVQQEMQTNQQRAQQEFQSKWTKWATDEDSKFLEAAPEMSNKETAAKVTAKATELLNDLGFTESDINSLWSGQASVSLRDHRVQLLIRDAMRYREAKAAVPKAVVKPVPKVQRPGTPTERASDRDVELAALNKKLDSGEASWRDGAEMIIARRGGRR